MSHPPRASIPNVFSYVVARDEGLAPNPFYGFCTLSCCKTGIRKKAKIGDLVLGTTSRPKGVVAKLLFIMRVTQIMDLNNYWQDPRFLEKRPNLSGSTKQVFGDNFYHKDSGGWIQENSRHTNYDGSPHKKHLAQDTGGPVLISNDFVYFGNNCKPVPSSLSWVVKDRSGYKYKCFTVSQRQQVVSHFDGLEKGVHGLPSDWGKKLVRKFL